MNGIYITGTRKKLGADGVKYKINSQCETLRTVFGVNIRLVYNSNNLSDRLIKYIPLYSNQIDLDSLKNIKDIDFIYMRKPIIDYNFINKLKKLRKVNTKLKVFMEIPTYPYDQEPKKNIFMRYLRIKDKIWRSKLVEVIDYVVTYSKDKKIFKVPTININNAANFDNITRKTKKFNKCNKINMTAIAFFQNYHGYDRLINGIGVYYKNKGMYDINLNLIGNGNKKVIENYQKLITKYGLQKHIKLYKAMNTAEMTRIFDNTDIAVDTLARFRSGIYYNSTLKGKEYLARGIPILSGVETELDNRKFKFYHRVPSDESFVDINEVIEFFNKVIVNNNHTDEEISRYIRDYGIRNFSFKNSMQPIMEKLTMSDIKD